MIEHEQTRSSIHYSACYGMASPPGERIRYPGGGYHRINHRLLIRYASFVYDSFLLVFGTRSYRRRPRGGVHFCVCVCVGKHMHTARSQGFTWQTFASFLKPFVMHKQGEEKGDSNQISASLFVVPDAPLCSLLLASWCGQLNVERGV